jgi:hypothetical protein
LLRFTAASADEVHLNLAYRWFCRLGLGRNNSCFSRGDGKPSLSLAFIRRSYEKARLCYGLGAGRLASTITYFRYRLTPVTYLFPFGQLRES